MNCPKCGYWNRDSFPRCFKCGAALTRASADKQAWQMNSQSAKSPKLLTLFDTPYAETSHEDMYAVADEMRSLKARRAVGKARLSKLSQPTRSTGTIPRDPYVFEPDLDDASDAEMSDRTPYTSSYTSSYTSVEDDDIRLNTVRSKYTPKPFNKPTPKPAVKPVRGRTREYARSERPDAVASLASARARRDAYASPLSENPLDVEIEPYVIGADMPPIETDTHALMLVSTKLAKRKEAFGAFAAAVWLLRILVGLAALAVCALAFVKFIMPIMRLNDNKTEYIIEATEVGGYPGHMIKIPGEDGDKIIVRELSHTYTVISGYATIEAPDYSFYEINGLSTPDAETVKVTLTPSLDGSTPLAPVVFDVDVPQTSVTVIEPKSSWTQVSTAVGLVQLQVAPGSKVVIDGDDISDTMDDSGLITSQRPVQPKGDNNISIAVTAPHSRTEYLSVTFYRPPMEIPLELKEDTGSRSSVSNANVSEPAQTGENYFLINATTMVGATIMIETPYKNLNTSNINTTGEFSFMPVFSQIGDNNIRIRAKYPSKMDSVLEYSVYYMPPASEYSKKAWALAASDYNELLNNIDHRIGQIYLCKGKVVREISASPQLVLMDTGKNGSEQLVLLENKSMDIWTLGESYNIYADVSGLYDNMPRMMGRYTYPIN